MKARVLIALMVLALPAQATEKIMGADAFEEFSRNKTLYFSFQGAPYGAEQFFSGRRSLWQHSDGTCTAGAWHDNGDELCFLYEDNLELQCWVMFERDGSFFVRADDAGPGEELKLERKDAVPLPCIGPDLGV